ncbi:hypothetical protein QBC42DRAFT_57050 [Cladorrhinum samala]|uniref:Uncharacterized protein n=1 Tax=Cladorrhinum samala TaxID=585594 RepID=A0AAV9HVP9_9PEZI|nr:hypothetical protein QBC42DRAFT_57050 [Cladorrhinum samala]
MGVQLEPLSQNSFEQYGPWHFRDSRFHRDQQRVDLGAALLRAAVHVPAINDRLSELPPKPPRGGDERVLLHESGDKPPSLKFPKLPPSPRNTCSPLPSPPLSGERFIPPPLTIAHEVEEDDAVTVPASKPAFFGLTEFGPLLKEVVITFPLRKAPPPPPRPNLKRRRAETDVDGVNTACLGCKKRRLLRHLFTSRLSKPSSSPATHILNREGVASGDKKFLRLAAIMSARRLQHQTSALPVPNQSSLLRRHAVHNSFRMRMSARAPGVGDAMGPKPAPLQQHPSLGMPGSIVGARYLAPPGPTPNPMLVLPRPGVVHPAVTQASAALEVLRTAPGPQTPPFSMVNSPSTLIPPPGPPQGRLRIPSPRLRPVRSPELRVTRPALGLDDFDDLDDDCVAFPTSEHESRYEDEPEDVYADFGLIFGNGGGDCESSDDESGDHFEDYMDDLDGIPWNARC